MTDLSDLRSSTPSDWQGPMPSGWLQTTGNRIEWSDGRAFRGRGVTLHDTRSCWACPYFEPSPTEVVRRMDELVDRWGANFIRLALESYAERPEYAVQWKGILEDTVYLDDIVAIVHHAGTKSNVVVSVTLWVDPTVSSQGWPTPATREEWKKLASVFVNDPYVMFSLGNGVDGNQDGSLDAQAWQAMNDTVQVIRDVENAAGRPPHLIAVQGTRGGGDLRYYLDHPITAGGGRNIVYEALIGDLTQPNYATYITQPAQKLPIIIGAFAPTTTVTLNDCTALMDLAESVGIPYMGFSFHMRCAETMNMLVDHSDGGCGAGMALDPTPWGQLIKDRLAQPW